MDVETGAHDEVMLLPTLHIQRWVEFPVLSTLAGFFIDSLAHAKISPSRYPLALFRYCSAVLAAHPTNVRHLTGVAAPV